MISAAISAIFGFFRGNPVALKALGVLCLVFAITVSYNKWADHYIERGIAQEKARRDKIDADNKYKADAALAEANKKVEVAEQKLADASLKIAQKETELQHVKTDNQIMQSDLIAKRKRLSVLVSSSDPAGNSKDSTTGPVDQGAKVTAELDGQVAANLVELVGIGDQAIIRLNACIEKYEKVEEIVNSAK